jgi:hypothetical protein
VKALNLSPSAAKTKTKTKTKIKKKKQTRKAIGFCLRFPFGVEKNLVSLVTVGKKSFYFFSQFS